jgi:branched-chain amino acid aminotransferase
MPKVAWVNGEIVPLEEARVSVLDHAHLYGDGLFEGIRFYKQKVWRLDAHLDRLYHGINYLGFEMHIPQAEMRELVLETCRASGEIDGYIRLNVTRGTGLGLDPRNIDRTPSVVIAVSTIALYHPELYTVGIDVITSSYRMSPTDVLDPRLKCIGGYASNILAKMEGYKQGAHESLKLNHQGIVAECTGDNVFMIKDGVVKTPHPSCGILKGITRDVVLELAPTLGYRTEETFLTVFDFFTADEAFVTGTAAEIAPMVKLDGKPIGSGKPGPITLALTKAFHEATQHGTPFMV